MKQKLLVGVSGVLTPRQEQIIKEKINASVPHIEVVCVPFMTTAVMVSENEIEHKIDGKQLVNKSVNGKR